MQETNDDVEDAECGINGKLLKVSNENVKLFVFEKMTHGRPKAMFLFREMVTLGRGQLSRRRNLFPPARGVIENNTIRKCKRQCYLLFL